MRRTLALTAILLAAVAAPPLATTASAQDPDPFAPARPPPLRPLPPPSAAPTPRPPPPRPAQAPAPSPPTAAVPADPNRPAKTCKIDTPAGFINFAIGRHWTMTLSNDGWCTLGSSFTPFLSGKPGPWEVINMTANPQHGEVRHRKTNAGDFFDYKPAPGYTGKDRFTFRALPGNGYFEADIIVTNP